MPRVSPALESRLRDPVLPERGLSAGPLDPLLLQRQFDAYELRAAGATIRDIANMLGVARETITADIHAEGTRRVALVAAEHEQKVALSVARYEGVILRALNRLAQNEEYRLARGIMSPNRNAYLDERLVIDAQERIDRVLGLLRGMPGVNGALADGQPDTTVNLVLQQFMTLPPEIRLELLRAVRERKNGEAVR